MFNKIQIEIERLLNLLHARIGNTGLLGFRRGDCRIDITGHMLSGLHHLVTNKMYQKQKGGLLSSLMNVYFRNKQHYRSLC
mgnify:CR=1 FL=1